MHNSGLLEKLTKLKEKQLPLLYSYECLEFLKTLNLKPDKIEQQVYFKAQLFFPYVNRNIHLKQLNNNCIVGFYINSKELHRFKGCKFYIPTKKDWLITPYTNVNWLSYRDFVVSSTASLKRQFSLLCWLKKENGEMEKFFLVWWA
ncbi:DUF1853 family protein [Polaribacter batillariae]|uniref:DUF1853 family protein n=1 Tax=Polaribacter batillariae TaxID=2808900 RepID=UPI001FB0ACED|nr:DUF1853 family protein [Polaribacter batillariae]